MSVEVVSAVPAELGEAVSDGITVAMGEDGQLSFAFPEAPAEEPAAETPPAETPQAAPEPPPAPAAPVKETVDAERYKELQREFTKRNEESKAMRAELEALKAALPKPPAEPTGVDALFADIPEGELIHILNDPAKAKNFLVSLADQIAEKKVSSLREAIAPQIAQHEVQREWNECVAKYGADFVKLQPQIKEFITKAPTEVTFAQAYEFVSSFVRPANTSPQDAATEARIAPPGATPAVPAPPAPPAAVASAAARADRLAGSQHADTGRAGSTSEPTRVSRTTREAFDLAFAEASGG